jgi:hypothetical protein
MRVLLKAGVCLLSAMALSQVKSMLAATNTGQPALRVEGLKE